MYPNQKVYTIHKHETEMPDFTEYVNVKDSRATLRRDIGFYVGTTVGSCYNLY